MIIYAYAFNGEATGSSNHNGSVIGFFGFDAIAVRGEAPIIPDLEGEASGGYAYAGSGAGERDSSGTGLGWFTYTAVAVGEGVDPEYRFTPPTYRRILNPLPLTKRKARPIPMTETMSVVRIGGTLTLVKAPTGEQLAAGVEGEDWFIGGHEYLVSPAIGEELEAAGFTVYGPPNEGQAEGAYAFAGSATGEALEGIAVGGYDFSGSAVGNWPFNGFVIGGYALTGTATGVTVRGGSATSSYAFAGTATGDNTEASGYGAGTYGSGTYGV